MRREGEVASKQLNTRVTPTQYKVFKKLVKDCKGKESQADLLRSAVDMLIKSRSEGVFG